MSAKQPITLPLLPLCDGCRRPLVDGECQNPLCVHFKLWDSPNDTNWVAFCAVTVMIDKHPAVSDDAAVVPKVIGDVNLIIDWLLAWKEAAMKATPVTGPQATPPADPAPACDKCGKADKSLKRVYFPDIYATFHVCHGCKVELEHKHKSRHGLRGRPDTYGWHYHRRYKAVFAALVEAGRFDPDEFRCMFAEAGVWP